MSSQLMIFGAVSLIAIIISLIAAFWSYQVKKMLNIFFAETGHDEFGEVLLSHQRQLRRAEQQTKAIEQRLTHLENDANFFLNQVGFVKFNPFADSGGNMSFSLALLNNNGDGAVITSLHSREGTRFYSKQIKLYKCDQSLMDEETAAIEKAKNNN